MAKQTLILPPVIAEQLTALALATPEAEVCGLLGGKANVIHSFHPVANVASDPACEFLLDAEGQIKAMREIRQKNESLRAIFHSHPCAPAEPSITDRQQATYADVYYIIVSLIGSPPISKAYYFDGHAFFPISIRSN